MSGAVPKLRFPEFANSWRSAHAGEAFSKGTAKGKPGLPLYSVTMDRGLVPRDSLDRHMGDDAEDGENLRAEPGDIVYNTMRMWQGAAGVADTTCMVSPAYVVLKPNEDTCSEFFNYWFCNKRMRHVLWAYSYGLTNDRLRLYFDDFARIPIHLPSLAEQQKISNFLGALDSKIAALKERQGALQRYKQGLMQKLFSREWRFTSDDGSAFPDWEERRLGDIGSFSKGKGISKSDISTDGSTPCIRYGEIYTTYGERITEVSSRTNCPVEGLRLSKGGEIIIPASGETAQDIARACYVALSGVALGGDINIFSSEQSGEFLAYFLTHARRSEIARVAQGISVVHLYAAQLAAISVPIPHRHEQRKIADALIAIDSKSIAVGEQISKMETFKKGLLQQMFI